MADKDNSNMHPYLRRRREHILEFEEVMLAEDRDEDVNYLCAAECHYLGHALDCLEVCLDDLAKKFLVRARLSIDEAFRRGVRPYIGVNAAGGSNCDDGELNHHWAIAYKTRYQIDLLLKAVGDPDDLVCGMEHLERLWRHTDGLKDPMAVAREDVLCDYLWLGIAMGEPVRAIERASQHVKTAITPRTRIRGFLQEHAYLRFSLLVARFASGEATLCEAVRRSFINLFDVHWDIEHEIYRTCRAGWRYAFEWAWLWELVFVSEPTVGHAVAILRGEVDLDEPVTPQDHPAGHKRAAPRRKKQEQPRIRPDSDTIKTITCETCDRGVQLARSVRLRPGLQKPLEDLLRRFPSPRDVPPEQRDEFERAFRQFNRNQTYRRAFICEACYKALDKGVGDGWIVGKRARTQWCLSGEGRHGRAAVYDYDKWKRFQRRKASQMDVDFK